MGKIYERNPDTGEIRERDFDDYTGESVKIYREKKPEDFGTGKMIPTYNPDAIQMHHGLTKELMKIKVVIY